MKTLLVIGLVFPEPTSSAAGTRILQLIALFQVQNYKIVFASSSLESENSFDLGSINVEKKNIELNSSSFDEFVKILNPEIVLFDRFISEEQFGWRVAENCPNAIRILDTEDLHCLRNARHKAVKKNTEFQIESILEEETTLREIASIYRSDLSLIISDYEMEVLKNIFKIDTSLLYYLPMFYQKSEKIIPFKDRKDFTFIGNFLHEPNYDTVLQLKVLWKEIKKQLPLINLNIYGAYPSQKIQQLHNEKEGFLVKGRAVNAFEILENARVLLAPLRFGAGIKGKLLEAMVVGTPSITTKIGEEGIEKSENWNGFIIKNEVEFVEKSVELYQNSSLWIEKQNLGFKTLQNNFSKAKYENQFANFISQLILSIKEHRKNNFIGKLIYQNQFSSTKFMSKWIEEKNKKC